jgi:hypothetical protein
MILAMGMSHHQWLGRRCSVTEEGPNRPAITIIDALEYLCRVNVRDWAAAEHRCPRRR